MDLAVDLTKYYGRQAKPVSVEVIRPLTASDVALLDVERGIKAPLVKKLRDSHHGLARLIAQGASATQIAAQTGYSISRISILRHDPAFAELVSFYKANLEELRDLAQAELQTKMKELGVDLIEEMRDRLHENPEQVSNDDIDRWTKTVLDRSGYGPQSRSTNLNVVVDLAEASAAGRQRAARLSAATGGPIYEAVPVDQPGQERSGTQKLLTGSPQEKKE